MPSSLKQKTVHVDGLGRLGERIPLIEWLIAQGARVTVTDSRTADACAGMMRRVEEHIKRAARDGENYQDMRARLVWAIGDRSPARVRSAKLAIRADADAARLFFTHRKGKTIVVTGARGKTTAAIWAAHLIGDAVVAGHSSERPLFSAIDERRKAVVAELSSSSAAAHAGRVPVVVVGGESPGRSLPGFDAKAFSIRWGAHNLPAGHAAVAAARAAGVADMRIAARLASLPEVPHRQEVIVRNSRLTVVNDAAAMMSAHGVAALERWGGPTTILIAGGGHPAGDYRAWADAVRSNIRRTNVILLAGPVTRAMRSALGAWGTGIRAYDSLAVAYAAARKRAGAYVAGVILYSPVADPSEAFADVRERGQQFNALVEEHR